MHSAQSKSCHAALPYMKVHKTLFILKGIGIGIGDTRPEILGIGNFPRNPSGATSSARPGGGPAPPAATLLIIILIIEEKVHTQVDSISPPLA